MIRVVYGVSNVVSPSTSCVYAQLCVCFELQIEQRGLSESSSNVHAQQFCFFRACFWASKGSLYSFTGSPRPARAFTMTATLSGDSALVFAPRCSSFLGS